MKILAQQMDRAAAQNAMQRRREHGPAWEDVIACNNYAINRSSGDMEPVRFGSKDLGFIVAEESGLRVLHTERVAFFDVDLGPNEKAGAVLQELHRYVAINPEYGFRVYRTAAGLRYLCTTHLMDPAGEDVQALMRGLRVDSKYQSMCLVSRCFAARLNPKPARAKLACPQAVTAYQFTTGNPLVLPECLTVLKLHDQETGAFSNLPLA